MAPKDILVVCDGSDGSQGAVGHALNLAKAWDAHLTGIVTHGVSMVMANMGAWAPEEVYSVMAENDARVRAGIREGFDAQTDPAGREGKIHYIDVSGDPDAALMRAARCYDLIVMGPHDRAADQAHFRPHPDVVALRGARPVLFVPARAANAPAPARAVLAWDGQGAAARALSEAIPVLSGMDTVTVLSVGDEDSEIAISNAEAVRHLLRHGINAQSLVRPRDGSIARTLMATCAAEGAGLLVMGAYEHSKLAEDIFGGVTNAILDEATLPVFMAH